MIEYNALGKQRILEIIREKVEPTLKGNLFDFQPLTDKEKEELGDRFLKSLGIEKGKSYKKALLDGHTLKIYPLEGEIINYYTDKIPCSFCGELIFIEDKLRFGTVLVCKKCYDIETSRLDFGNY